MHIHPMYGSILHIDSAQADADADAQASGFADGLIPNPLQRRCTWEYDQLDAVVQANIARCSPPAVDQLAAFKDFENHLYNDVYPVLVRTRLVCICSSWRL